MGRNLLPLLFLLLAAALSGVASAQLPGEDAIRVIPSRTEIEIGERMSLRFIVEADLPVTAMEVTFPGEQRPMLRPGPLRQVGDREYEMTIRPLRSGDQHFGPLDFELTLEGVDGPLPLTTGSFPLTVAGAPETGEDELRGYTGPLDMAYDYTLRNLVYAGGGLLALALLALAAYGVMAWMRRRAAIASIVPPVPPIEAARERIARLKGLELYDTEGAERHYTELSMILRRYIEDQMGLHTAEMTEDEVVELIRGPLKRLGKSETLVDLFRRSSMAKFARNPLTRDQAAQDCVTAESFLVAEAARLEALRAAMEREKSRQNAREREGERAA